MFVGRKKELNYLSDCFRKEGSQILVVYGHKGVGKTSLLFRFAENTQRLTDGSLFHYYTARPCSEKEQLLLWNRELGQDTKEIDRDGQEGFEEIFGKIHAKASGKKQLIVVDEFQNIVKYSKGFMEAAIRFTKTSETPCLLVLLSSAISFVETDLVPRIGSLALGIGGFLKVPEMGFMDCVNYFKECNTRQCMEIFSILGGIPAYWECFDASKSIEQNITDAVLKKGAPLREEGENIVARDLRELNVYNTILHCLANGENKLNDLHVHTGFSRAKISVYIKNLMERELVEKVFPFENASAINAKKGVYRITLRYLEFYYRFLFGRYSKLERLAPAEYYQRIIADEIKSFHQTNFRKVCGEYLQLLNERNMLPIKAEKSGEWIGKNGAIDLVMQDAEENNLLAFCNWEKEELGIEDLQQIMQIAEAAKLSPDHLYLFSAGHFTQELKGYAAQRPSLELVDIDTL
ncbi:MAG: AAA family ATPase [Lachnospiraceae bacterium]|nr:AAA family ATPase [Lachnospiraceae bacterium]